jgi:hypothetical protein
MTEQRDTDVTELPSIAPDGPRIPTISPIYPPPMSPDDITTTPENPRPSNRPEASISPEDEFPLVEEDSATMVPHSLKAGRVATFPGFEGEPPAAAPKWFVDWDEERVRVKAEDAKILAAIDRKLDRTLADNRMLRRAFERHRTKANAHLAEHDGRLEAIDADQLRQDDTMEALIARLDAAGIPEFP